MVILALAWDRIAWAWASWAETTGPLCDSPPARNCQPHTHTSRKTQLKTNGVSLFSYNETSKGLPMLTNSYPAFTLHAYRYKHTSIISLLTRTHTLFGVCVTVLSVPQTLVLLCWTSWRLWGKWFVSKESGVTNFWPTGDAFRETYKMRWVPEIKHMMCEGRRTAQWACTRLLTGSIRMVPGSPGTPSEPGRPGRPGGPWKTKSTHGSVNLRKWAI